MSTAFLSVPLVLFCIFVAPIWLFLHYRSKREVGQGLSGEDAQLLHRLTERAEKLQLRVDTLERILDIESPNWRQR